LPTYVGKTKFGAVTLTNVYFCAQCPINLISESRLLESGASVIKNSESMNAVVSKSGQDLLTASLVDKLFVVDSVFNGKAIQLFR